jgi:hypothetical protein
MRLSASKTTRFDFLPLVSLVELDTEEGEEVHAVTTLTMVNSKQMSNLVFMHSPSPENSQDTACRQSRLFSLVY